MVNSEGKLVDEISIRDLRGVRSTSCNQWVWGRSRELTHLGVLVCHSQINWGAESFWRLYGTISNFKSWVRARWPLDSKGPQIVGMADNLSTCLDLLADGRKHRLFAVDAMSCPIKVVTQRDVLAAMLLAAKVGA